MDIILRGIGSLIIGAIATYIAYQQYQTNLQKLKLDLYDRRLKIFDSIMELGFIISMATVENEDESLLTQLKRVKAYKNEAYFLLGEEIDTTIDRLCESGESLISLKDQIIIYKNELKNRKVEIEQTYKKAENPLFFEELDCAKKLQMNWESSKEKNELTKQIELLEDKFLQTKDWFYKEINNMRDIFYPYLYFANVLVRNNKK